VTLLEGDHPLEVDHDVLAARRHPPHVTRERARACPTRARTRGRRRRRTTGLVVDVDAHDLGVRSVDDRLPDLGETVRLLGVTDREDLVEAVDERAVLVRVRPSG
jgi:methylmalonyl-CoA mutase cobalamin-binding subunit